MRETNRLSLLEFRVSIRYAPGTRWSEGLAIAEDSPNMSRPWPRPKRPPTDAYHEKGKENKLWCVCIHAQHKMPSVTIFGDGVGPAAHEERAVHTTCSVVSKNEIKYLDPCTWVTESSYHTYLKTWNTGGRTLLKFAFLFRGESRCYC